MIYQFSLRRGVVALAVLTTLIAMVVLGAGCAPARPIADGRSGAVTAAATPAPGVVVDVGRALSVPALPDGFVGLSLEYNTIAQDVGSPADPDRPLAALIDGLGQGAHPSIRLGGDSADHTWVPAAGLAANPGLSFPLTPDRLADLHTFAGLTQARFLLDLNLEADDPRLTAIEAAALRRAVNGAVSSFEVGNEPDLYGAYPWYTTGRGRHAFAHFARPRHYSLGSYLHEFDAVAAALPGQPLAGPALGPPALGPPSRWLAQLPGILGLEPRMRLDTYHAYPLNCYAGPGSSAHADLANLLSPTSSLGLAAGLSQYLEEAHAAGRPFRIDEMNSSACGGTTGVSDVFASALWMCDALFALAERGVDGVNVQDYDGARYAPFAVTHANHRWLVRVAPIYYGMRLFALAAPPGSRFLETGLLGRDSGAVQAFAAQTPTGSADAGARTVTLTNDSTTRPVNVLVEVPGAGAARITRLLAPRAAATDAISLGSQSFAAATSTGTLPNAPASTPVGPVAQHAFMVTLAPASAATLTVAP